MKGVRKLSSGRYQARYFAGLKKDGSRFYPTRVFLSEVDAHRWYLAGRLEARQNPHAATTRPNGWLAQTYGSLKGSAKKRRIEFALTFDEFEALIDRANGRCELTGIQFEFQKAATKSGRRPFAPSVDRRDPSLGYTVENCRVVCSAVNYALGDWGIDCLLRIARELVTRHSAVPAPQSKGFYPSPVVNNMNVCSGCGGVNEHTQWACPERLKKPHVVDMYRLPSERSSLLSKKRATACGS